MSFRPTSEQDRAALKAAARRLVRSGGGQTEAALATRVGQQHLSRYGSPNHPNEHMPIDVLMDLTIDTDDADVIRTLCRLANGVFVPLPRTSDAVTNWPAAVGKAVKRGADAAEAICTALNDDGQITPEEIADLEILNKLSAAIEALVVLQTYARSAGGEG
ncbi:phage regulatory CII family protein [uncultured Roseibium sp.]|uniref:phage regulatory CII family protein n=1 Tax=uncultured Roseibium sp. TaxID=1936171 RepID=UPI0026040A9D|nr:phage regulatory CII family protein [uncultured Roseibium sp.]